MKVLLCGKGGCGKSTVASLLAGAYAAGGKNVLVVDCDESNYGLHRQLGLELPEDFTHYFGGKKGAYKELDSKGRVFDKKWTLDDVPSEYTSQKDGIRLIAVGKISEAGEGCACGIGFLAKEFLNNLETGDNDIVIVDTEAGVEHFGRGVDEFADAIIMVVDPSYESIHLSGKVCDMCRTFGKPVYIVINKADEAQEKLIRETIRDRDAVIAAIRPDADIMEAGLKGEPLTADIPEIGVIADKLGKA